MKQIEKVDSGIAVRFNGKEKIFKNKPIFFPSKYKEVKEKFLEGNDVVVIGMNGYSSITTKDCKNWGIKEGAYEAACEAILRNIIKYLWEVFPGVDIRVVHGASDMGVDKAIIRIAKELNIIQLGHSCPEYMMYVADDEIPVYVAGNKEAYANSFVESLDILIAANGRVHAFTHDIDATFKKSKYLLPVNVIRAISANGGAPAFGPNGEIEDAVSAFEQRVYMVSSQLGQKPISMWNELNINITSVMENIVRNMISPQRAFGNFG